MTSFANEFLHRILIIVLMMTNNLLGSIHIQSKIFAIFEQKSRNIKHIHNLTNTHSAFYFKRK